MKNVIIRILFIVIVNTTFLACSISKRQTLYNTYLVKHRKYNLEQIFSYPSDVNFWKAQDSTKYLMIDTLEYKVKIKGRGQ